MYADVKTRLEGEHRRRVFAEEMASPVPADLARIGWPAFGVRGSVVNRTMFAVLAGHEGLLKLRW